jgi:hypothetical protein
MGHIASLTPSKRANGLVAVYVALNILTGFNGISGAWAVPDLAGQRVGPEDTDLRMAEILRKPIDFCDPQAIAQRDHDYDLLAFQRANYELKAGRRHQSIPANVKAVEKAAADDGMLKENPPIVADYRAAFNRNDTAAQRDLWAKMTPWERGLAAEAKKDFPLAISILTPLADQNDHKAQREVAGLYAWGTATGATPRPFSNKDLAFKYWKMAAVGGDELAQEQLAVDYACGRGTPKDLVRAYTWFSIALSQIAVSLRTYYGPENIMPMREFIAGEMTHDEIMLARRLVVRCYKSEYTDCDNSPSGG